MKPWLLFCLPLLLFACTEDAPADPETASEPSGDPGIAAVTAQIEADADNPELYAQRATLYYDKKNYDGAIRDLTKALSIDSTNLAYHYDLSDVYLRYYRSRLALRTLQRAVALDPDNLESQLRLAELHLTLEQYPESIKALDQVIRLDPRNPDAFYYLGSAFLAQGDTARAIKATEEATEADPDFTDAYIRMGRLLAAKGLPRAEQYYDAAVAIDPTDAVALHARGDFYRDQERIDEAIAAYRSIGPVDRQYVDGYYNAGLLLLEKDSVEAALREFNLVLQNDPINIQGYFFRGYARELLGNNEGARDDYQIALRYAPDYTLAQEGLQRVSN